MMNNLAHLLRTRDELRLALATLDSAIHLARSNGEVASASACPPAYATVLSQVIERLCTKECKSGATQSWLCADLRIASRTFTKAMLYSGNLAEKRGRLWFAKKG